MAVCFFNKNYDERFECQYELKRYGIEVTANYDISEEIPDNNGLRVFGSNTKFDNRDILIVDYPNKKNYLLKNAHYSGHTEVWGTPDGGNKTKFFSQIYFSNKDYEKLSELSDTDKISKIRIYSNAVNNQIGYPSFMHEENDDEYVIRLKKKIDKEKIEINENNIKNLIINDDWTSKHSIKNNEINIQLNGYIEIELEEEIEYEKVYEYIKECSMYFQLYNPDTFNINKVIVLINKSYYEIHTNFEGIDYKDTYIKNTVKDNLAVFLSKCYKLIPYRNSKNEIRNIPWIIMDISRNIEDNFLMFYRFIECYYKRQHIKDIKSTFLEYAIRNNYNFKEIIDDDNIEKMVFQLISLRNHYAHEGYYINNNKLYIAFPKIDNKANPKNYIETNVNFEWIYDRTKILYKIVIDIIFKNMLNYDIYNFEKHF